YAAALNAAAAPVTCFGRASALSAQTMRSHDPSLPKRRHQMVPPFSVPCPELLVPCPDERRRQILLFGLLRGNAVGDENLLEFLALEGFDLDQALRDSIERRAVLFEDLPGTSLRLVNDARHLSVYLCRNILRVRGVAVAVRSVRHRTERIRHAVARHHVACERDNDRKIVRRPGGKIAEYQFFRD